ncbi:MAG: hypothetical protein ACRC5M_06220 [Anaeroplasmataceae bacterium]
MKKDYLMMHKENTKEIITSVNFKDKLKELLVKTFSYEDLHVRTDEINVYIKFDNNHTNVVVNFIGCDRNFIDFTLFKIRELRYSMTNYYKDPIVSIECIRMSLEYLSSVHCIGLDVDKMISKLRMPRYGTIDRSKLPSE